MILYNFILNNLGYHKVYFIANRVCSAYVQHDNIPYSLLHMTCVGFDYVKYIIQVVHFIAAQIFNDGG